MMCQILLPCYFGTEIILELDEIRNGVYAANWIGMTVTQRKLIINFMERLKRPVKITSKSFFDVNIVTFMKVSDICICSWDRFGLAV